MAHVTQRRRAAFDVFKDDEDDNPQEGEGSGPPDQLALPGSAPDTNALEIPNTWVLAHRRKQADMMTSSLGVPSTFTSPVSSPGRRKQTSQLDVETALALAAGGSIASAASKNQGVLKKVGMTKESVRRFRYATLCMMLWAVLVSVLLLAMALEITTTALDNERDVYVTMGSIPRMAAAVDLYFSPFTRARDMLYQAARSGLYSSPDDLDTLERVLRPMFAAQPLLFAIEVGFLLSNVSVSYHRSPVDLGIGVKAASNDCWTIDVLGCAASVTADERVRAQDWFLRGVTLSGDHSGAEAAEGETPVFAWQGPVFVTEDSTQGRTVRVGRSWAPAYAMIFRVDLEGGEAMVIKATVSTATLGDSLRDPKLSSHVDFASFVTTSSGLLLGSARGTSDCTTADEASAVRKLRFRGVHEVEGDWAPQLDPTQLTGVAELMAGNLQVDVAPLTGALADLRVVVVSSDSIFLQGRMRLSAIMCVLAGLIPYGVVLGAVVYLVMRNRAIERRYKQRYGGDLKEAQAVAAAAKGKAPVVPFQ